MTDISKGGRGKRAPYTTEHYRIPTPLKAVINEICNNYRELVQNYYDPYDSQLIDSAVKGTSPQDSLILDLDTRLATANKTIEELREENEYLQKYLADKVSFLEKVIQHNHELKVNQDKILTQALKLRANAGGAIKREIEKAIALGKVTD
jgi:hypothetical protein